MTISAAHSSPSTLPDSLDPTALRLAVVRLARRLRQAAESGVTPSQLSALVTVERHGPLSLRELAAAERVGSSTLTRVVAALEEQGLLERTTDPTDRRVALVHVTAEGAALLATARDRATQMLAGRVLALDDAQVAALAAAVPVLEALVEDQR